MEPRQKNGRRHAAVLAGLVGWTGLTQSVWADGATRDLSGYTAPGTAFTVTITLVPPAGTHVAGVEEAPPASWVVSSISDSGTWDAGTEEVKWGPFFDPSIPGAVTYDVTPPGEVTGEHCFGGTVTFDTLNASIGGDDCLPLTIPTMSGWGAVALLLLLLTAGTLVLRRPEPV